MVQEVEVQTLKNIFNESHELHFPLVLLATPFSSSLIV